MILRDTRRRARAVRASAVATAVLAAGALLAPAAEATEWSFGKTGSPTAWSQTVCRFPQPRDIVQVSIDRTAGLGYSAPYGGLLTSWSTQGGLAAVQLLGLKVVRPVAPDTYLVVGRDGPRPIGPNVLNTFPIEIPVQAGDLIALSVPADTPGACRFDTGRSLDLLGFGKGDAGVGATLRVEEPAGGFRLNLAATVLPAPVATTLHPDEGSFQGGTKVKVIGENFERVTGVSFGSIPAQSFSVRFEGRLIVAVAPPGSISSRVPITVSTAAGIATTEQTFSYEGCKVPRLKGKSMRQSKRAIRRAGCRMTKPSRRKGATPRTGRVAKQNPKAGAAVPTDSKVRIVLRPPTALGKP